MVYLREKTYGIFAYEYECVNQPLSTSATRIILKYKYFDCFAYLYHKDFEIFNIVSR